MLDEEWILWYFRAFSLLLSSRRQRHISEGSAALSLPRESLPELLHQNIDPPHLPSPTNFLQPLNLIRYPFDDWRGLETTSTKLYRFESISKNACTVLSTRSFRHRPIPIRITFDFQRPNTGLYTSQLSFIQLLLEISSANKQPSQLPQNNPFISRGCLRWYL